MYSVDKYVRRNGIKDVLEALDRISNDQEEPHEFAMNNKIDMDDWFEFLWEMDMAMSSSFRSSDLAIPDFNYVKVEDEFASFVEDNAPVSYGDAVEHVAKNVDSVDDQESVARWCEFMNLEVNDDDEILSAERSYTA